MRLVEVTACRCNIGPIRRGAASGQIQGVLKTSHATELLWCDTDLIGEHLDKMPLAQPEMRGEVSSPRSPASRSKMSKAANRSMFFQRVLQTSDEGLFQNAEPPGWIRSRAESFAQIGSSPKRFQIHMSMGEFICWNA